MISEDDATKLVTSKFYRMQVGESHKLRVMDWHYKEVDNFSKNEKVPAFVCKVVQEDNKNIIPAQQWEVRGLVNRKLLTASALAAQREGREYLVLHVSRPTRDVTQIVDLVMVDRASGDPYDYPRS